MHVYDVMEIVVPVNADKMGEWEYLLKRYQIRETRTVQGLPQTLEEAEQDMDKSLEPIPASMERPFKREAVRQPGDASPKPELGEAKEAKTEKEPPKDEELKEEDPRTEEAKAEPSASSSGPEPSGKPRAFYPPDPSGSGAKRPGSMSSKLIEPGGTAGADEKSELSLIHI